MLTRHRHDVPKGHMRWKPDSTGGGGRAAGRRATGGGRRRRISGGPKREKPLARLAPLSFAPPKEGGRIVSRQRSQGKLTERAEGMP